MRYKIILIRFLSWIILLAFMVGCILPTLTSHPTRPTLTPSSPSRTLRSRDHFPWQERWRAVVQLGTYNENVRDLIAVRDGVVLVDNPTGYQDWLKFIKASDGNLQWTVEMEGRVDAVTADENLVYIISNAGQVVAAYYLQSGELAWRSSTTLPDHTGYYLRLQEKGLYAYSSKDFTYVFDAGTGSLIDEFSIANIGEKPTVLLDLGNGEILQSDGKQILLTQAGEVVWQTELSGRPDKFPQIYNNLLIVRLKNDRAVFPVLAGLDLETGKVIWQVGGLFSNFTIENNLLYVISNKVNILTLDPQTGRLIGQADLIPDTVDIAHPLSAITVNENMLYIYFGDSRELIAFEKVNE